MNLREFELLQQKHERSGLSEAVFCKENDICRATYRYWKKKQKIQGKPKIDFFEISPSNLLSSTSINTHFECVLSNGRVLRIPQTFDPLSLKNIISILDS
jgi:hypothetical protein